MIRQLFSFSRLAKRPLWRKNMEVIETIDSDCDNRKKNCAILNYTIWIWVHCLFQTRRGGQGHNDYLWVRNLRGFLSQTAALRWNQVIILSADVLVRVVQTSRTGPRWRPGQTKQKGGRERWKPRKERERQCLYEGGEKLHLIIIIIFLSGKLWSALFFENTMSKH